MLGHATGSKYFVTTYILTIYDYDSDFLILKLATTLLICGAQTTNSITTSGAHSHFLRSVIRIKNLFFSKTLT